MMGGRLLPHSLHNTRAPTRKNGHMHTQALERACSTYEQPRSSCWGVTQARISINTVTLQTLERVRGRAPSDGGRRRAHAHTGSLQRLYVNLHSAACRCGRCVSQTPAMGANGFLLLGPETEVSGAGRRREADGKGVGPGHSHTRTRGRADPGRPQKQGSA